MKDKTGVVIFFHIYYRGIDKFEHSPRILVYFPSILCSLALTEKAATSWKNSQKISPLGKQNACPHFYRKSTFNREVIRKYSLVIF